MDRGKDGAMPIRFVCPVCWSVRDGLDDAVVGKMIKCQECHAMSPAKHTPAPNASAAHKAAAPRQPAASGSSPPPIPFAPVSGAAPVAMPVSSHAPHAPAPRVLFSSGDIPQRYEVVDLVFAHGNSAEEDMAGMQPVQAFQMLVNWLGQTALQIGANAVIHIRIDFRPVAGGFLGGKQAFEVYGYGTAVKILG
jgi:hypothetical protein